jgi:hypothetical protein
MAVVVAEVRGRFSQRIIAAARQDERRERPRTGRRRASNAARAVIEQRKEESRREAERLGGDACERCNGEKAEVERHVSSVTLFRSPARAEDERTDARAAHKAGRDYHPDKKGVLVQDAGGQHDLQFGPSISFGLVSPPQLNGSYVNRRALHHVQGLFSLLTSADPRDPQRTRLLPPDQCWVLGHYNHSDWGNPM